MLAIIVCLEGRVLFFIYTMGQYLKETACWLLLLVPERNVMLGTLNLIGKVYNTNPDHLNRVPLLHILLDGSD